MPAGFLRSPAVFRGLRAGAAALLLASSACGGKVEDPLPPYKLDPHLGPPGVVDAGRREVVEGDAADDLPDGAEPADDPLDPVR